MTVYVDDAAIPATVGQRMSRWSHLFADTEQELHAFARILGLRREWYRPTNEAPDRSSPFSHYDITDHKRQQAIQFGAIPVTWSDSTHVMRARTALANQADHAAGLAWRAGDTGRAEQLIETALQLDPGRAALWAKRLAVIAGTRRRTQPVADGQPETRQQTLSAAARQAHEDQLALEGEGSADDVAAKPNDTDAALAAVQRWNAAAYRRVGRSAPSDETARP